MSGTPPVPIIPPDPQFDRTESGELLRDAEDAVPCAPEDRAAEAGRIDPDLDADLIDSADADRRASTEGVLDGDD